MLEPMFTMIQHKVHNDFKIPHGIEKKKDVSELQINSVNDENPYLHVYAH